MKQPRVSIIIPLKDTLPYFKKCCDSLLAQTCGDIEIIIVDDASSQDISGFLNRYGHTQKLVYLRNEVSLGPDACQNLGLDIAQGQYISFCNSDDWVDLNFYEHVCDHMDKTTADLVMVSMKREFSFRNKDDETYMCRYSFSFAKWFQFCQIVSLTPNCIRLLPKGLYFLAKEPQNKNSPTLECKNRHKNTRK